MQQQSLTTGRAGCFLKPFLILLLSFAFSLLSAQSPVKVHGSWTATIEGEKADFRFEKNEEGLNGPTGQGFLVRELSTLPTAKADSFSIRRDAGTLQFTGLFINGEGKGSFVFIPTPAYYAFMQEKEIGELSAKDLFTFFLVNVRMRFVQTIVDNGFTDVSKKHLIPLAALGVDEGYIGFWKQNGYKDLKLSSLIPLKSLNVTEADVKGFAGLGYQTIDPGTLIPFKSLGITPAYINSFQVLGFKNVPLSEFIPLKSLGVTSEEVSAFQKLGFTDFNLSEMIPLKSNGVTPEYVASMQKKGINYKRLQKYLQLKAMD